MKSGFLSEQFLLRAPGMAEQFSNGKYAVAALLAIPESKARLPVLSDSRQYPLIQWIRIVPLPEMEAKHISDS